MKTIQGKVSLNDRNKIVLVTVSIHSKVDMVLEAGTQIIRQDRYPQGAYLILMEESDIKQTLKISLLSLVVEI